MKRWWLIGVAGVLGIGLAVLFIPRPDTGGDAPDRAQHLPRLQGSDIPPVTGEEDWHPDRVRQEGEEGDEGGSERVARIAPAERRTGGAGEGNPLSQATMEARNTPEVRSITRAATPWTQITRLLRGAEGNPLAEGLADQSHQLVKDLRDARREPWDLDYQEYVSRQKALAGAIRQSGAVDPEMEKALNRVDQIMREYEAELEQIKQGE